LDTSVGGSNVRHVLKVSLDLTRYEYYTIGTYDEKKDRYYPDEALVDGWAGLRYDYGNFYASKTFFDPSTNRRILWGWANESDSVQQDRNKGWAGIQVILGGILNSWGLLLTCLKSFLLVNNIFFNCILLVDSKEGVARS
jgi:beta-fructofuranosidase